MRFQPGFSQPPVSSRSLEHLAALTDQNSQDDYTLSGVDFGAANSDRALIAAFAIAYDSGVKPTSVTIGGVSATEIATAEKNYGGSTSDVCYCIYGAFVPTGTSGNVVITNANARGGLHGDLYRVVGLNGVFDIKATVQHASTLSTNTAENDVILGIAAVYPTSLPTSGPTWTGLTQQSLVGFGDFQMVKSRSSSALETTTQTPRSIGISVSPSGEALVAVLQ